MINIHIYIIIYTCVFIIILTVSKIFRLNHSSNLRKLSGVSSRFWDPMKHLAVGIPPPDYTWSGKGLPGHLRHG